MKLEFLVNWKIKDIVEDENMFVGDVKEMMLVMYVFGNIFFLFVEKL